MGEPWQARALDSLLLLQLRGDAADLALPAAIAVAALLLRVVVEKACVPILRAALPPPGATVADSDDEGEDGEGDGKSAAAAAVAAAKQRQDAAAARRAFKVFDNAFIALAAGSLLIWAWHVMLNYNGGCKPWSPRPCLTGWPDIPVTPQFRLFWMAMIGYYLYEMLGTALRVGCILSGEMVAHHVVTMVLMLLGYYYATHRFGLMGTALLDTSNPLLHAAKALNYAALPGPRAAATRDAAIKLFALVFFVARVLMMPFSLLLPGLRDGRALPLGAYAFANALMLIIFGFQLFWFYKILRVATGQAGGKKKSKPAAKVA